MTYQEKYPIGPDLDYALNPAEASFGDQREKNGELYDE
jgi:hypothetical protein